MSARPVEAELAVHINACAVCRWLGVEARPGEGDGMVVLQRGHARGMWSYHRGAVVFRNVAAWTIVRRAADVESAYRATVDMAEENRWT